VELQREEFAIPSYKLEYIKYKGKIPNKGSSLYPAKIEIAPETKEPLVGQSSKNKGPF
jgi:hypothetical protein